MTGLIGIDENPKMVNRFVKYQWSLSGTIFYLIRGGQIYARKTKEKKSDHISSSI